FVLRVEGVAVQPNGGARIGQTLDHIAHFEIVLAVAVRREPPGRLIETQRLPRTTTRPARGAERRYQRVVERLRELMTERRHVLEGGAEEPGRDPRGVGHRVGPRAIAVRRNARLEVELVEA